MSDTRSEWTSDPQSLAGVVDSAKRENSARVLLDKCLLRLYYQRPVSAVPDPMRPYQELSTFETLQQLGFNLTREVIDAAAALICQPMRAVVQPVGSDYDLFRSCEVLTKLVDGIFDASDFMSVATQAFIDGSITTVGAVKWFVDPNTKEIQCERIDPLSVLWHYDEGARPAHLYLETPAAKSLLREMYPAKAGAIETQGAWKVPTIVGVEAPGVRGTDTVRVVEAWKRKISDSPGRHTITCGDVVLCDEPWDYDFFPVVCYRSAPDFRGFGGVPMARQIAPYHIWSNTLVRLVNDSLKGAVPWLLIHEDDNVDNVSDMPYQKIVWSGPREPVIQKQNPVSDQVIAQIKELRERAFGEVGVNINAAGGSRPTGLNSAPSQREWMDIVNVRMRRQQQQWERFWNESSRCVVALASDAYRSKAARVAAPGSKFLEEVKWPRDIKEDQYRMVFALASGLSLTTSGRMEQLGELRDRGAIDEGDYLEKLGLPDVQQLADRVNAPRKLVEKQISAALNEGTFIMPSALQASSLDALVTIGTQEYQAAMEAGRVPPENIEVLRRLIKAADARRKGLASPPPLPPPVVPAVLPGQPGAVAPLPNRDQVVLPPPPVAPAPPISQPPSL